MKKLWNAWKRKHWEPTWTDGYFDKYFCAPGQLVYPRLRRLARWAAKLWAEKPLTVLTLIATIIFGVWGMLIAAR